MTTSVHIPDWIEALPADGRYTFTRMDAEEATGTSFIAVQSALRRQKVKGRIVSPRRGFYVVVPPEHRAIGSPPASWFIDDLMRFCRCEYYVGLLSAAAIHGASHQQPMVFQVLTDRLQARMRSGRVLIDARKSRMVGRFPTERVQTETGTMSVSTPETTALDLVRLPRASGAWSNVATVVTELAERIDGNRLVAAAERGQLSDAQRLGYVLDSIGHTNLAAPLAAWVHSRRTTVVPLRTGRPTPNLNLRNRWRVLPNETLEPDL